ncbi:MAG: sulfatase-like hydrolase/transferase [Planctomycetes bacterium]|nr:sulfatase-like hydrolase/transferase [Planctomycetota bacterium]
MSSSLSLSMVLAVLLMGTGAPAATSSAPADRPNVLLIVSDDQRPDTIHAFGNPVIRTPHLDQLARNGTVFTRAVSPNPICTPARAEIMTGCCGFRNGVTGFGGRIRSDVALWARTFQQAGYHTWYVGKWHNDGRPSGRGYEESDGLFSGGGGRWPLTNPVDWKGRPVTGYRGWVFQTDDGRKFPEQGVGLTPNISEAFADAAIRFIRRKPRRPFFLHINFTAPHDPLLWPRGYEGLYNPSDIPVPPNFLPEHPFDHGNLRGRDERLFAFPRTKQEVREELAVYYAVITHMDAQIGRLLQALAETGQIDNTLIIFTSDQGVAIGSHGLRGKQNMYEHTIGVPLILSGPGIPKGRRCGAQCYLRDLFPTTCELVGLPVPASVQGKSLLPILRGERKKLYPYVFAYFRSCQRMVRTDRWKLIRYPQIDREQLFDLSADPFERHDLSGDPAHRDILSRLRTLLVSAQKEYEDPLLQP